MCFQATEQHSRMSDTEGLAEWREHTVSGNLLPGHVLALEAWRSHL